MAITNFSMVPRTIGDHCSSCSKLSTLVLMNLLSTIKTSGGNGESSSKKPEHLDQHGWDNSAGMVIRPEAGAILERDYEAWQDKSPPVGVLHYFHYNSQMFKPVTDDAFVPEEYWLDWTSYYLNFLYNTPEWRREHLDNLTRVETLCKHYKRKILRGQHGVFANKRIPKKSLIGAYAGGAVIRQGNLANKAFDRRAEFMWVHERDPSLQDADIGTYCYGVRLLSNNELVISGLIRGNAMKLVNSYWAPPETSDDNYNDYNVDGVTIRMDNHLPIVVFYANRDIDQDEELMTHYGSTYAWTKKKNQEERGVDPKLMSAINWFVQESAQIEMPWTLKAESPEQMQAYLDELRDMGFPADDFCVDRETFTIEATLVTVFDRELSCPVIAPLVGRSAWNYDLMRCCMSRDGGYELPKNLHVIGSQRAQIRDANLRTVDNGAGLLVRPEAAAVLERDTAEWIDSNPTPGALYFYSYNTNKYVDITTFNDTTDVQGWKDYYLKFLYSTPEYRREYIERMIRIETLGPEYPVPVLRGQSGIRAIVDIPINTLLGTYAGVVIKHGYTGNTASLDRRAETDWLKRNLHHLITETDISYYAYSLELHTNYSGDSLSISGLGHGNALSLINCNWAPPETHEENMHKRNVFGGVVRMDGHVPMVIYYTARDIKAGEELLTNYGTGYNWAGNTVRKAVAPWDAVVTNMFVRDAGYSNGNWKLAFASQQAVELELSGILERLFFMGVKAEQMCFNEQTNTLEVTRSGILSKAHQCPKFLINRNMDIDLGQKLQCCLKRPRKLVAKDEICPCLKLHSVQGTEFD